MPTGPIHAVAQRCLCIIAQGRKEVHLGEHPYRYAPYHYLLVTAELPLVDHVLQASKEQPYLSLRLMLSEELDAATGLPGGLQRRLALQPRVQSALRPAAAARRRTAAGSQPEEGVVINQKPVIGMGVWNHALLDLLSIRRLEPKGNEYIPRFVY